MMQRIFFAVFLLIAIGLISVSDALAEPAKRIVLIAGPKSHGPGEHEYLKSIKLLKVLLDRAPNLKGVQTEIYFNGWPPHPSILDRADTIGIFSDGELGSQPNSFHAPFMTGARMKILEKQMSRGCGFVVFHFAIFSSTQYAPQMLNWVGGYFDWESGHDEGGLFGLKNDSSRQRWHSAIRYVDVDIELAMPQHPLSQGVTPFRLRDEFYYQLVFRKNDSRLIPVLRAPTLSTRRTDQIVAWAVEREDGGRSFGTSAGHDFNNWQNDNFRALILNALTWTAGVAVPKAGVDSTYMSEEEVDHALMTKPISTLYVGDPAQTESEREESAAAITKALNSETPRFNIDVAAGSQFKNNLSHYKLLVVNNCDAIRDLARQSREQLRHYFKSGGGLIIVSSANQDDAKVISAPGHEWTEAQRICKDVSWRQADDNASLDERSMFDVAYTITLRQPDNPITRSMNDYDVFKFDLHFNLAPTLMFTLKDREGIRVLASARAENERLGKPVVFLVPYEKSRIVQVMAGRNVKSVLRYPRIIQFIRYGGLWAAGQSNR